MFLLGLNTIIVCYNILQSICGTQSEVMVLKEFLSSTVKMLNICFQDSSNCFILLWCYFCLLLKKSTLAYVHLGLWFVIRRMQMANNWYITMLRRKKVFFLSSNTSAPKCCSLLGN